MTILTEQTLIYVVLDLRSWSDFETAPDCWSPFPVGIKGDGIGFFVVYDTLEEAEKAAEGRPVLPLKMTTKKTGTP